MSTWRRRIRATAFVAVILMAAVLPLLSPPAAAPAETNPPGFDLLAGHSGKALDVAGASSDDGAPVIQWSRNHGLNQRWAPLAFGNAWVFVNLNSGKVLDLAGSSTENGAALVQQHWSGATSQVWVLAPFGPDFQVFVNYASGKVMDVAQASTADGAAVVQWDWNGGTNQLWHGAASRVIDAIRDTGGATKVITVVSPAWSSSTASLILWERRQDGSWDQVAGPWDAAVGRAGWAYEPGESTLRSPIGSFGFGTGFGLQANPGYAGGWFVIGNTDYWVEDPASPDYNTHQQGPADPAQAPWGHFEHLIDFPVAYRYAALINFNVPPHGGIGSGIFLHDSTGGPTAGCVSLPEDQLLATLRWIDPANTRIVMGPESELGNL
ncbi:MAG TPA: RICIN domain-containing protein [Acidimicrobiales bacterium]|jgi:L,D-peptidoglycan transpeptidase YkuD (ErfK/YbiS/YcfS/YnhG family)|nr:RICIN domain-containing protein [Acidimicrobiales bacterium]